MSIKNYEHLLFQADYKNAHFVHIYDDAFVHNVANNVLGRYDDHRIGKIVKVENGCVHVQYASDDNIGIYDMQALGIVSVKLKDYDDDRSKGSLGDPEDNEVGIISYFTEEDKVMVRALGKNKPPSIYKTSELLFTVDVLHSPLLKILGGYRRTTLRNNKFPSLYTRFVKRV